MCSTLKKDKPEPSQQRLIHSGKMLENGQKLSDLNLNTDTQGSAVIHMVVSRAPSPPTPPPPVAEPRPEPVEPEVTPAAPAPPPQPAPVVEPVGDDWQTPELKRYFKTWDLSIRCHQLSEKHKHMVPQLQLYKVKKPTVEFFIRAQYYWESNSIGS